MGKGDGNKNNQENISLSNRLKSFFQISKSAYKELQAHDPLLLSSSVAFFTLFSLPPILIILISIMKALFKERGLGRQLFEALAEVFGQKVADQIAYIISNFQNLGDSIWFTIFGTVFLVFVATTTFSIVHKALNQIWQVKEKPKSNFVRFLRDRAVSLIIIFFSGSLFIISIFCDTLITLLGNYIMLKLPSSASYLLLFINQLFSIAIVSAWFAIIFKYLVDVKIKWTVVCLGALVTASLFTLGKYILTKILVNSNLSTIYGAAGSVVLLLLFIFYASMILFYGAAFIKTVANYKNYKIKPRSYSVIYEINEVESEKV